ncbi:MAG: hypothetical protein ACHQU1_06895 [Gemmatimonadales bacterium]
MSADQGENSRIQSALVSTFRSHASGHAALILVGNIVPLSIAVILFQNDVPGLRVYWWAALVLVATLLRASWRLRGAHLHVSDASYLARSRAVVVLQGLCWSLGLAYFMPWVPIDEMTIAMAGFAAIIGSAISTLASDPPSFRRLTLSTFGPLPFGLLAVSTDKTHIVLVALIVPFIFVLLYLHHRVHAALVEHLRTVDRLSMSEKAQAELIGELQTALGAVKQLTGLLPICANCKKVRDDFGYWNSVEHYISKHTDARFSHGVCPDCFPKLFPGVDMTELEEEHV